MRYCCEVDGCRSQKTNEKLSFFTLPRDQERRKKWLDVMGRPDLLNKKLSCHFVCSLHFDKTLIKYKPQLQADALPTKLLPSQASTSSADTDEDYIDVSTQTEESFCLQISEDNKKTIGSVKNEKSVRGKQKVQNNIKVFCPKCNSKVSHTAEGIQLDQTKIIVAKVYNYFEQEYEELKKTIEGIDQTPLSKFRQRTALATGVSETMVEEIMQEEARRNEDMPQQTLQRQSLARKRPRQTDRSIEDGSSDENIANDDDETQTLVIKEAPVEPYNEEPEIFVALSNVKQEPGVFGDNQELTDPIAIEVKTEPRDEEETNESTKASTTEVQTITSRKRKKTNAQKCREYRERKKLQNTMVQNITAERSDECGETDQLPAKKPKTDAERRKKYYEAQKLKKQKSKKIPKTAKQRNKECYDRKKKLQALNTLNHHSDVSNETTAVQRATKGFKKIKTERNTDGPPAASAPPATSAPPAPPATSAPLERKMMPLEDFEVKMEKIEIGEEGFS